MSENQELLSNFPEHVKWEYEAGKVKYLVFSDIASVPPRTDDVIASRDTRLQRHTPDEGSRRRLTSS